MAINDPSPPKPFATHEGPSIETADGPWWVRMAEALAKMMMAVVAALVGIMTRRWRPAPSAAQPPRPQAVARTPAYHAAANRPSPPTNQPVRLRMQGALVRPPRPAPALKPGTRLEGLARKWNKQHRESDATAKQRVALQQAYLAARRPQAVTHGPQREFNPESPRRPG